MRPVLHGDVVAAARALLPLPEAERPAAMARLLAEADAADRYRRRMGRVHRLWGNGSLMAAAMARPLPPEPFLADPDYLRCLIVVLEALLARQTGRRFPGCIGRSIC